MANRIFLNDEGYVEVQIEGPQTYMTFQNIYPTAIEILDKLQREGKKRLGLIDISKQQGFSPDSNRSAMEILESLNYDKVAIYGGGKLLEEITRAIILAMGKTGNTKLFSDRKSAISWLLVKSDKD